jgi:hypothetical protein
LDRANDKLRAPQHRADDNISTPQDGGSLETTVRSAALGRVWSLGVVFFYAAIAALMCTPVHAASLPTKPAAPLKSRAALDRDLARLADMFDGEFDNYAYARAQIDAEVPVDGLEGRRLKTFTRVDLPAFGPYASYVQQYLGDPPSAVYRQRIYRHSADYTTGELVTDIFAFRSKAEAERALDAGKSPAKLAGFTPQNMDAVPRGCEVRWQRVGDHFLGKQDPATCRYIPSGSSFTRPVRLADTIYLSETALITTTQFFDDKGVMVFGNKLGLADVGYRAQRFACRVSAAASEAELSLNDQGGQATIPRPNGAAGSLTVLLARDTPEAGTDRHLRLALWHDDDTNTVVSSAALSSTDAIAINAHGAQVSCRRSRER